MMFGMQEKQTVQMVITRYFRGILENRLLSVLLLCLTGGCKFDIMSDIIMDTIEKTVADKNLLDNERNVMDDIAHQISWRLSQSIKDSIWNPVHLVELSIFIGIFDNIEAVE